MSTRTRLVPVDTHFADGTPIRDYDPRLKAVEFLREKIAERTAGLDPYDAALFIVHAGEHEKVAARTFLTCVGEILNAFDLPDGSKRFRAVIEADVRMELGLDGESPPLMEDEPLASRAVGDSFVSLISVAREARDAEQTQNSDTVMAAIEKARDAYDRRYPGGIDAQLAISNETEGEAS